MTQPRGRICSDRRVCRWDDQRFERLGEAGESISEWLTELRRGLQFVKESPDSIEGDLATGELRKVLSFGREAGWWRCSRERTAPCAQEDYLRVRKKRRLAGLVSMS